MGCETSHALRVSVDVAMNYDEVAKRPAVFVGTLEEPQWGEMCSVEGFVIVGNFSCRIQLG